MLTMQQDVPSILEYANNAVLDALTQPPDEAEKTLLAAIQSLSHYADEDTQGEVCYALGCCWYHIPKESQKRIAETKQWLQRALQHNPNHHYAHLYLGHLFFDMHHYQDAGGLFDTIPSEYFRHFGQRWRDLKRRELLLCCKIYMHPSLIDVGFFHSVQEEYLNNPAEAPLPSELIESLVWAIEKENNSPSLSLVVKDFIGWLNSANLTMSFSEEIDRFSKFLKDS